MFKAVKTLKSHAENTCSLLPKFVHYAEKQTRREQSIYRRATNYKLGGRGIGVRFAAGKMISFPHRAFRFGDHLDSYPMSIGVLPPGEGVKR
jgi:hypothetical protein